MKDEWPKRCETKEGEKKENESEDFRWWEERERERESKEKEVLQGVGEGVSFGRACERERERFHKPGYASILHRKPTPTFTLAARPDDSMLKDGRLAG